MSSFENYFDDQAGKYLESSDKGFWAFLRKKEKEAVLHSLEPFAGMRCIDLGCGAGYYTQLLLSYSPSVIVGVDRSFTMLNHLKDKDILRAQADIQTVAFQKSFDRVLCAGALEFLINIEPFLENAKAFLAKDGLMTILLPKRGIWGFFYKFFHWSHSVPIQLFSYRELENKLNKCGFKLQDITCPTPMTYVLKIVHR
jgi:cyclopropane fatty-acyl-phospholipid synthase-like methyltransferase